MFQSHYKRFIARYKKLDGISISGSILSSSILFFLIISFFPGSFLSWIYRFNSSSPDPNILIVAIDDTTLNAQSSSRFSDMSRCDIARGIKNITRGDPKVIGVDIFFSSRSKEQICDEELKNLLRKNSNIVLGTEYLEQEKRILPLFDAQEKFASVGLVNVNSHYPTSFFSNYGISSGGSDKKNNVLFYTKGKNIEILPLAHTIYARIQGEIQGTITDSHLEIKNERIPHKDGRFYTNFFTDTYPSISFIDVINNRFDPEEFRGKIVLIGATAHDLHDEFLTPFSQNSFMPGVVFHANVLNTLLSKKYLQPVEFSLQLFLGILFCILMTIGLHSSQGILRSAIITSLYFAGIILGAILLFLFGYLLEVFPYGVVFVFLWIWALGKKYYQERKMKNEIRAMFGKYISTEVVNELISQGKENLKLGGTQREVTVFFSDLVGFTDMSEKLSPEELGKILNIYFESMSNVILSQKGTIDKYIGDAIMAFWNAPLPLVNHAELACRSALLQQMALIQVQKDIHSSYPENTGLKIAMRIGIHTGNAVIGNFGSHQRYDYTALGDTVNLASRLEGINKQYKTKILISEATWNQLPKNLFLTREIDSITVKGKEIPVRIFELVDIRNSETEKLGIEKKIQSFEQGLSLYRKGNFSEALSYFKECSDETSEIFIHRCKNFLLNGTPQGWDGVYRFHEK